ncbi:DUF2950 family protein [Planctomycetota bacterium]
MKKGFTLIELMIVIAIIAIIAAVAIPSLIKSKISANEGAAAAGLKTYNGMMATFKKSNYQGIGRKYPPGTGSARNSGKYCALYYEVNNAGDRVTLIGVADANADCRADGDTAGDEEGGTYAPVIKTTGSASYQTAATFNGVNKAGYWYGMCTQYGGTSYDLTQASNHYGICAFPDDYGSSGQTTFIVTEEGTVYSMDFGTAVWRNVPGADPVSEGWEIAQ